MMIKDIQYYKFSAYGFLKNLRFFDPFLVLFFLEKGLSFTQIGLLYVVREIVTNILEIPSGIVADCFGRRSSMIMSFAAYILSFIGFFLFSDFFLFMAAMLLFSFGEAFRTGTHKAMIFEYLRINAWQGSKTEYYGHTRSWSKIGSAVSAVIAGALVLWQGSYKTVFLFSIIPYLIDLLLMISYPEYLDGQKKGKMKWGDFTDQFMTTTRDFLKSLKEPGIILVLTDSSLFSGFLQGVKDFLQPMLQVLALSIPFLAGLEDSSRIAVFIGLWYSGIYIITAAGSSCSGFLAQKAGSKKLLQLSLLVGAGFGIISGILGWLDYLTASAILFSLLYVIENIRKPAAISMVSDSVSDDLQASFLSVDSQIKTLFAAFFSLLMGILSDWIGVAPGLMINCSILLFLWILLRLVQKIVGLPGRAG